MNQLTKNLFHPGDYMKHLNLLLLVVRLAVGALMLTHGLSKLTLLFGSGPIQFPDPIGLGVTTSLVLAVFTEVICSFLLIFGLGTRFAAIGLLITMLTAALIVHSNDPFARQELPLLYATIYLVIIIAGAGKFSVDNWLHSIVNRK